jgi:hypothetical protein
METHTIFCYLVRGTGGKIKLVKSHYEVPQDLDLIHKTLQTVAFQKDAYHKRKLTTEPLFC